MTGFSGAGLSVTRSERTSSTSAVVNAMHGTSARNQKRSPGSRDIAASASVASQRAPSRSHSFFSLLLLAAIVPMPMATSRIPAALEVMMDAAV